MIFDGNSDVVPRLFERPAGQAQRPHEWGRRKLKLAPQPPAPPLMKALWSVHSLRAAQNSFALRPEAR